jgi:Ni/Fe-hydrogenase subunit HybB-like protein
MKQITAVFGVVHAVIAVLFALAALALIAIAASMGFEAVTEGLGLPQAQALIEAIGILAAAVVAFQIAETITEEEVVRDANISAPTRVRRFLSRFFVVVIVALAIEGLVMTFRAAHEEAADMIYAAALLVGTGVLLAAWGYFIYCNRSAEELEPDAMEEAKEEDKKIDG